MSPEKRMEAPGQERNRQENPDEAILRYIGKPLESIGMLPAKSNPKNCGILFQGDSVLSSGTYFAWTDALGLFVYIADFRVLENRPFSMKFPEFVSVRHDALSRPGENAIASFAEVAERNAFTLLKKGTHYNYVEVQYLEAYFESRLRDDEVSLHELATDLLSLKRKVSWSLEIARSFDAIKNCAFSGPAAKLVFSGSADMIMGAILGMKNALTLNRDDKDAIACVVRYIDQNLDKPLRQEDMLALAGMSASKFKKLFKQIVGRSMSDYIADRRMERAKELLLCGQPIKTVSEQIGIRSPAYFTTFFRRASGKSPSEWRKASRARTLPPSDTANQIMYPDS